MWETGRIRRYEREIRAIGDAVTDPDDIAVILRLEEQFKRVKADAARKLLDAGYSQRDIARGAGRHVRSVQQWLEIHAPQKQGNDATCGTDD
jgi:1,6-anhydro-N-acetylmuramate kinase